MIEIQSKHNWKEKTTCVRLTHFTVISFQSHSLSHRTGPTPPRAFSQGPHTACRRRTLRAARGPMCAPSPSLLCQSPDILVLLTTLGRPFLRGKYTSTADCIFQKRLGLKPSLQKNPKCRGKKPDLKSIFKQMDEPLQPQERPSPTRIIPLLERKINSTLQINLQVFENSERKSEQREAWCSQSPLHRVPMVPGFYLLRAPTQRPRRPKAGNSSLKCCREEEGRQASVSYMSYQVTRFPQEMCLRGECLTPQG